MARLTTLRRFCVFEKTIGLPLSATSMVEKIGWAAPGCYDGTPGLQEILNIIRMQKIRFLPTPSLDLLQREAGVGKPSLIERLDGPVRAGTPDEGRNAVDNLPQV
jgi:hypothetical protein